MKRCLGFLVLAALLAGCGGGGAPPSATPSTSTASLPPALAPGTYHSQAFQPELTFTVPDGWWIAGDSIDYLALQPVASDQVGIFLFRDPFAASQDQAACPQTPEPSIGTASTDLSAWIRQLPGLVTSNPRLASVGGLRGTEIDVKIAVGWRESCSFANGLPTVPLFVGQNNDLRWVIAGSEQLRLSLLDVPGGGTVVVDVDAFDGTLDGLLQSATPVVNSFVFAAQ